MSDGDHRSQLEKLIALRSIAGVELIIEWDASAPQEDQRRLADRLDTVLAVQYPQGQGDVFRPPTGRVRIGRDRKAQIIPGRVAINAELSGNHCRDWELAVAYVRKHWPRVLAAFEEADVEARFLAFVWTVKLSTSGLDLVPSAIITKHVDVPAWNHPLEDADFRVATSYDQRYYVNLGFTSYASMNFTVKTSGEQIDVFRDPADRGLQVRVDVNTKYNIVNDLSPIVVDHRDFERCLELSTDAVEEELPKLLLA